MSETNPLPPKPTDLILHRLNRMEKRLQDAVDGLSGQIRLLIRVAEVVQRDSTALRSEMAELRKEVRDTSSELLLMANRVETAVSQAMRTDLRVDEIEDREPS